MGVDIFKEGQLSKQPIQALEDCQLKVSYSKNYGFRYELVYEGISYRKAADIKILDA